MDELDDLDEQRRREKAELARLNELNDIRELLALPQGIRFFRRLMSEGRLFRTSMTGNSNTFFLEGRRSMALWVMAEIFEAAPQLTPQVMIFEETEHDKK